MVQKICKSFLLVACGISLFTSVLAAGNTGSDCQGVAVTVKNKSGVWLQVLDKTNTKKSKVVVWGWHAKQCYAAGDSAMIAPVIHGLNDEAFQRVAISEKTTTITCSAVGWPNFISCSADA